MNREFMEFMRANYNHVSQQEFKMTVLRDGTPAPPSSSLASPATPRSAISHGTEWETPTGELRLEDDVTDGNGPNTLPAPP